jgi:hypothetical protein
MPEILEFFFVTKNKIFKGSVKKLGTLKIRVTRLGLMSGVGIHEHRGEGA